MKPVHLCIPTSLVLLVLNLSSPDYLGFSVPPLPSLGKGLIEKPTEKKKECQPVEKGGLSEFIEKQTGKAQCNSPST